MNRRGFIVNANIIRYLAWLLFGLGSWFLFSSSKDFIVERYGATPTATFLMGAGIVFFIFIFYRFKLYNLVPR